MENAADDFVKSYIEGVHRRCDREASKDRTQEKGNQAQAKNDGQDVGSPVSESTSTATSAADTKIHTSSFTCQEQNKKSTATPSSGIDANDNALISRTNQEQRQIRESCPEIVDEPPQRAVPPSGNSNSESFTLIDTILQEAEIIRSMAVDSDDVLFTGSDMMIHKWHKGQQVSNLMSFKGTCYAIAAKYMQYPVPCVFVAHDMGEITFWASRIDDTLMLQCTLLQWDGRIDDTVNAPRNYPISCLCLSDDFNFIYAGSADCTLNMWSARGDYDGPIDTINGHLSPINALAVGLSVVFSGSSNGIIRMWRRETYGSNADADENDHNQVRHLPIATFYAYEAVPVSVNALMFCAVDNVHGCLYAGSSDGNVRCWKNLSVNEPETANREFEVMSSHDSAVTCLAWCSGPFVFSGSRDKTICVWRRETDEALNHTTAMVLRGHTDGITCIACQNDWEVDNAAGTHQWILYSGSLDGTLRIWRVYEQPRAIMGGGEQPQPFRIRRC